MSTLLEVATLAGVSVATASRALNGAPGRRVRPELRERVLAAATELNYTPHAAAQTMARGHANSLGLLVNDISDPYFADIAAGVTDVAATQGTIVMLSSSGWTAAGRSDVLRVLAAQRVRAIIMAGGISVHDDVLPSLIDQLNTLRHNGTQIATIGAKIDGIPAIELPDTAGSEALVDHLVEQGCETFVIVAGPADHSVAATRAAAMRDRIAHHGKTLVDCINSDYDRDGGSRVASELASMPDAILCTNDLMALGVLRNLRSRGLSAPEDVLLTGFGNIDSLVDVIPGLTTIAVDTQLAGRSAAEIVLSETPPAENITLGYTLEIRDSTTPPIP